jgi:hypothetical protein
VAQRQRLTARRPQQGQITNKDVRRIANAAVDAGWAFSLTGSSHGRLTSPDGRAVIHFAGSASSQDAAKKLRSHLRRNGLRL